MIRQLTIALAAFGLMIAGANAAEMPVAPAKPGIAMHGSHLVTGRSCYHRHWHHHWHHHRHHR